MEERKIDRSKLKATSVAKAKEADADLRKLVGGKEGGSNWFKLENGGNIFRILPPHPGGDLYYAPRTVCRLPILSDETDKNGNATGHKVFVNKSVFNARVHGGLPKDIVEEYIKFAEVKAAQLYSKKEEQDTYLKPVRGEFSKVKENNISGILYKTTSIIYVCKVNGDSLELGKLEYGNAIKMRLNDIAATESEEDAMGLDPFTDVDEGRAIKITYNKESTTPQGYYKTELYSPTIPGSGGRIRLYPIPDEILEKWMAMDSLQKMYSNCFTQRDFELQIEGLQNLDKKYRFGIIDTPEFLEVIEYVADLIPQGESEAKEEFEDDTNLVQNSTTNNVSSNVEQKADIQVPAVEVAQEKPAAESDLGSDQSTAGSEEVKVDRLTALKNKWKKPTEQ